MWMLFCFAALVSAMRGPLYRLCIRYEPAPARTAYFPTNPLLQNAVGGAQNKDIQSVIDEALGVTSKHLHYTFGENAVDPNRLVETRSAHCVGYAAFFATVCNELLHRAHPAPEWKATARGQPYLVVQFQPPPTQSYAVFPRS